MFLDSALAMCGYDHLFKVLARYGYLHSTQCFDSVGSGGWDLWDLFSHEGVSGHISKSRLLLLKWWQHCWSCKNHLWTFLQKRNQFFKRKSPEDSERTPLSQKYNIHLSASPSCSALLTLCEMEGEFQGCDTGNVSFICEKEQEFRGESES